MENNSEIINEYEEKIRLLEKTFATLILLNNKRKIENEKNKIKIKYEIDNSLQEMKKEIQNHKKKMIIKIDDCFYKIQNNIIYMRNNNKLINSNICAQIEKSKYFLLNDIPKIYEESNKLNIENKENIIL